MIIQIDYPNYTMQQARLTNEKYNKYLKKSKGKFNTHKQRARLKLLHKAILLHNLAVSNRIEIKQTREEISKIIKEDIIKNQNEHILNLLLEEYK